MSFHVIGLEIKMHTMGCIFNIIFSMAVNVSSCGAIRTNEDRGKKKHARNNPYTPKPNDIM